MTILKMEAFGDFDSPYDINLCVGEKERIEKVCDVLNEFCRALPCCEQDVKLRNCLADKNHFNTLIRLLVEADCFSEKRAKDFVMILCKKCEFGVYVNKNTFSSELIVEI